LEYQTNLSEGGINNVFVIPFAENRFIVYLPLSGILFKANTAAVNLFYKALAGDSMAQEKLSLSQDLVARIKKENTDHQTIVPGSVQFTPTMVNLFLTTDCSMRCVYCYASGGESRINIKKEFVEVAISEIIKNAKTHKSPGIVVNFHGGGDIAVVWPLLEEITCYIKDKARENHLNTEFSAGLNGVLSDYQRKWIIDNIQSITLSLDGDEEIQNRLRPMKNGHPSFDIVDKTLKYFDTHNYNYAIRTTVTADTVDHLDRIIAFICSHYTVKRIKAEPVYIQGRANRYNVSMPDEEKFIKNFLKAKKIAAGVGKELLYSGARFEILTSSFCKATGASFGVTPEGYISSCYEVLDKNDPASDIFFYGKIEEGQIKIDQYKLDNLQKFIVTSKEKCRNCFAKFHCAGDCPVKSVLSTSDNKTSNYRCIINRELTKQQLLEAIEYE